ncbi:NYN domain protein [Delftia acidovorans]|uniref:NYN domain-containing protein n=1 Tax=Delftia acidovorans TaxID=80866 RepID=UPI000507EAF1|nr:NYN domain-containing protein [Delftia acidovorans]KFJ09434.1 NYN domain protein [Delftia acidovorans]QQB51046.1 NYN domain-containing protein [Delftia acidovorans]
MPEPQPRIALLIDADNAPAEMIDEILTELSTFGVIDIRRAYGNWTKHSLSGWQRKLLDFALRPMQQFDYSKHKNATDMAMTVDAMELLYTERPDAFGIVSSDADFTPLVMHLRSKGAAVYGFGMAQTPQPFVNACSRFLYLEALGEAVPANGNGQDATHEAGQAAVPPVAAAAVAASVQPSTGTGKERAQAEQAPSSLSAPEPQRPCLRVPSQELRQDTRLLSMLRSAVNATQDESGWAHVGAVGAQIGNKASFDARNYGYATLTKLLAATQAFEMRDEGTSRVAVRDKRMAKAQSRPSGN